MYLVRVSLIFALVFASTVVVPSDPAGAAVIESVTVNSNDSTPTSSSSSLVAGESYVLTVEGSFAYGSPVQGQESGVADAECSTLPPDPTFQRSRYALLAPDEDLLDVYVGQGGGLQQVEWQPTAADPFGCNSSDHTYVLTFEAIESAPIQFLVKEASNGAYRDNGGTLTVEISQPEEILLETLTVAAKHSPTVTSATSLDPGKRYRVLAEGTYMYGSAFGVNLGRADAECSHPVVDSPATWLRDTYRVLDPNEDPLDLYVNGENVAWQPTNGSPTGCNTDDHTYDLGLTGASGQLAFRIRDTQNAGDNTGSLTVSIFEVVGAPPGSPAGAPGAPQVALAEEVQVNSADPNGSSSAVPVREGDQLFMRAEGTYGYGAGLADPRCSTTTDDPTFQPSEENYPPPAFPGGILQLVINDQVVDWQPTMADATEPECNSSTHTYELVFVASTNGLLNFKVVDGNYGDNAGTLSVKIFRIREIPVGTVFVPASSSSGVLTPPLIDGRSYRFAASGTYNYFDNLPNTDADAECSQGYSSPPFTGLPDDPAFEAHRYGSGSGDLLDLVLGDEHVEWTPQDGSVDCDPNHAYQHTLTASGTAPLALRIDDPKPSDNSGEIRVDMFLRAS